MTPMDTPKPEGFPEPEDVPEEKNALKPMGIGATFGWAFVAFVIAQAAGAAIIIPGFPGIVPSSVSIERYDGTLVALVTLISNPVLVVVLALVARWRTGHRAAEYLGLTRFTLRDFLVGFLAVAVLAAAIDGASYLAGLDIVSTFQTEAYTSARANGWLPALVLAIVVVGPIGEEVMFRGFLFRGWVTPDARGVLAVIVITLLWAALHVQYDWLGISQVFVTGLLLGWIRWRSGSTLLTIVLHILVNLQSTIETMVAIGWSTP
jgi:CAAX protease family protein